MITPIFRPMKVEIKRYLFKLPKHADTQYIRTNKVHIENYENILRQFPNVANPPPPHIQEIKKELERILKIND